MTGVHGRAGAGHILPSQKLYPPNAFPSVPFMLDYESIIQTKHPMNLQLSVTVHVCSTH